MISFSQLLQKQFHIGTIYRNEFVNTFVKEEDTKQGVAKKEGKYPLDALRHKKKLSLSAGLVIYLLKVA